MPLHLKYRPSKLEEVVGNDAVKMSLKSLMENKERPHAYLFAGPTGSGKTTLGRIVATMLGCDPGDFAEFNTANTRGIDTIRDIAQSTHYSAMYGKVKVYLLDEAHQLLSASSNALLKVIEEPPPHVYFILCTTDPEKLLPTIRNRCSTFQVASLTDVQMKKLIDHVLKKEKITDFSEKVVKEIIRVSDGCPRQALVVLDSVLDIVDEKKALEAVCVTSPDEAEVIEICRGIMNRESWKTMKGKVKAVLAKTEPEKLRYAILGYFNSVVLSKDQPDREAEIIDLFSENTYNTGKAGISNMVFYATRL